MVGDGSFIKGLMDTEVYRESSDAQRITHLKTSLSTIVSQSRKNAIVNLANGDAKQLRRLADIQLKSFSPDVKRAMIEAFNKDRDEQFDSSNDRHVMDLFEYESRAYETEM